MKNDPMRSQEPQQDIGAMALDVAKLWRSIAVHSADIAHSKRTVFLAYVGEVFTEQQALELVMKL